MFKKFEKRWYVREFAKPLFKKKKKIQKMTNIAKIKTLNLGHFSHQEVVLLAASKCKT